MQFGLIGYPLSHSFSEGYFSKKFVELGLAETYGYRNYPLAQIEDLPELLLKEPKFRGLNVTIPYKEAVIEYLDELSPGAAAVGAVNTILFSGSKRIGFNTDVIGFGNTLDTFLEKSGGPAHHALILGTGGAAKAVAWVLEQRNILFHYVSRKAGPNQLTYEDLDENLMEKTDLIVNTTPLGMSPRIDTCPNIPYHCLSPKHRLYDLVYNPEETLFLQRGREAGSATLNGLLMLHGQAEAAWSIWTNTTKFTRNDVV